MKSSRQWNTPYRVKNRTLIISFPQPQRVISSAVLGGGIGRVKTILNHQVDTSCSGTERYRKSLESPGPFLIGLAKSLGLPRSGCVGLMTAVELKDLVRKRAKFGELWVEGYFTVGITNAVCVGESVRKPVSFRTPPVPGTINMILITNAHLVPSALVGGISVAVECKASVMLEHNIPSWTGRAGATGTGTDTTVLVSGSGPKLEYSGTHTKIGELFGCVVRAGIGAGLQQIAKST